MTGRMTTQQFLIRDIPGLDDIPARPTSVPTPEAVQAEQYRLRERYTQLIARFSDPTEQDSEEATFAHRRYAKMMVMSTGQHLRAALSLLRQGLQLTGAEVAAVVVGAERGEAIVGAVRMMIDAPQQLPAPAVAAALREYVLSSDSPRFDELRKALRA